MIIKHILPYKLLSLGVASEVRSDISRQSGTCNITYRPSAVFKATFPLSSILYKKLHLISHVLFVTRTMHQSMSGSIHQIAISEIERILRSFRIGKLAVCCQPSAPLPLKSSKSAHTAILLLLIESIKCYAHTLEGLQLIRRQASAHRYSPRSYHPKSRHIAAGSCHNPPKGATKPPYFLANGFITSLLVFWS